MAKGVDCCTAKHTIKVLQYEQQEYLHRGKVKKKLALVDKYLQLDEVVDCLREKMSDFPRHRFNMQHTQYVWEQLEDNLEEGGTIVKIQDFSENYTCLLPEEAQSIHWTQHQVTVFPVVVLRRVANEICEDHIVILR